MQYTPHLLVIRLSAMGDVAMTAPVIHAFIKKYPRAKVTVLSKPFLHPIFQQMAGVHFYAAEVNKKHKGILGLYKLYKELKKQQITHVADLHNVIRSKIVRTFLATTGAKVAYINKGRKEKKALTRIKNKVRKQLISTHQRYADVFKKLGFPIQISASDCLPVLSISDKVQKIIGTDVKKWIGIAPFAQYASKMYPLDLMEKVIAELNHANTYTIFLFGGGIKEKQQLEALANKYQHTISLVGKMSLSEELSLISKLDVMLSMDSGNGHFSAMYGVPTVTLWGVTHPYAGFVPFMQPLTNSILPNLEKFPNIPCSIYGNKVCEGYENAMRTIAPKTVVEKVKQLLS